MNIIITLIVIALFFHVYRQHITNKALTALPVVAFDGDIYTVGETVFAVRSGSADTTKTIVCFPGFTETMSYFTDLYKDESCQLILVNNALYHSPFDLGNATPLQWADNPHEVATIEYDGFYLAKIIDQYAAGSKIVVHGHSRGGAVVLDAGRQFPEITKTSGKEITALLEAAVVPKGTTVAPNPGKIGQSILVYLMPIGFNLYAKVSRERLAKMPMMSPTNELKTAMIMRNFRSPKFYWVYLTNVVNIPEWQEQQSHSLYENYHKVVLVQGCRDDVLVNETMEASALAGAKLNNEVEIIKTENTNHFVTLEQPHYIRAVVA